MVWNQSSQQERTGSPFVRLVQGKMRVRMVRDLGDGGVVVGATGAGCINELEKFVWDDRIAL